jgi:(+)-abscisic acid 8'-hydroxylase
MQSASVLALGLVAASIVAPLANFSVRPTLIRIFPRVAIIFGLTVLLYIAFIVVMAWQFPLLLAGMAAAALCLWAIIGWRSRDTYGRARQLPPGSLALFRVQPWLDRRYYTSLARRYGPIYKTSHFFTPMICMMRLDSALRLLKEHDDVHLRSPKVTADRFLPCGFLRGMDPAYHNRYRRVVQTIMTPQVVSAWERSIAADVEDAIEELSAQPHAYARPVWDRLLLRSFSRLFFGIAPDTDTFTTLQNGYAIIGRVSSRRIAVPWRPSERTAERTFAELTALLRRQLAHDCLLAELRRQAEFADSEQVLRMLLLMVQLSGQDMAGLVQWLVKTICDDPVVAEQLRDERGRESSTSPPSLLHRFTLETLRRHQVEHLYRRALVDIDWEGYRIPKGWLLRICLADAHRDATVFDDPDGFRPDRFLGDGPSQSEFLPFGAFRRTCLGDGVTFAFTRQFLSVAVRDWEWQQIGTSHEDYHGWHWTPGSDFRVSVRRRGVPPLP